MSLLIISVLALALGPVLYRIADAARPTLLILDGFVMIAICGLVVGAAPLLGRWIASQVPQALLLGPDEEAAQWVAVAAAASGLDHAVCVKQRHGDRDVAVALPSVPVAGRTGVFPLKWRLKRRCSVGWP